MTIFRVSPFLHCHPKRYRAGLRAMGLWVVAGSWSADVGTGGYVSRTALVTLGGRPADADRLVRAGLWAVAPGGWAFRNWPDHQEPLWR